MRNIPQALPTGGSAIGASHENTGHGEPAAVGEPIPVAELNPWLWWEKKWRRKNKMGRRKKKRRKKRKEKGLDASVLMYIYYIVS